MSNGYNLPKTNTGKPPKPYTRPVNFLARFNKLRKRGYYIPDVERYPGDKNRIIIKNQLLVHLDRPIERDAKDVGLHGIDVRSKSKEALFVRQVRVRRVCHCNPHLVLLEGNNIQYLIDKIAIEYSPDTITPPPKINTSSANDIRYSPDTITPPPKINTSGGSGGTPVFIVPASFDYQLRRIADGARTWETFPVVAVMDTGIDFAYPNTEKIPILYNGGSCMCNMVEPDYIGWDFVHDQNDPYDDDDNNKHGSRIAAIISKAMDHQVRILPLKVIDQAGVGSLFDIMCGFEYLLSEQLSTKPVAVNASWGFYSQQPNNMLTEYVNRLQEAQIWLINAAGNRGDVRINDIVDLTTQTRFPACYSDKHPNVVTVTTVREHDGPAGTGGGATFDAVENYSTTFVNIGISSGSNGTFLEPLVDNSDQSVKGSSYATPFAVAHLIKVKQPPTNLAGRDTLLVNLPGRITAAGLPVKNELVIPVEND